MAAMVRAGEQALIVQHCAVAGRIETPVRRFSVLAVAPYAQHPCSVTVEFKEPHKRGSFVYTMVPDDTRYLTIEMAGRVVYDSRADVPCDMAAWHQAAARFGNAPP